MDTHLSGSSGRVAEISSDASRSKTLPGWAYTDPALFAEETQKIFLKSWHYAGSIYELENPGDYVTANFLDQSVIVIRGRDGTLRGFHNVCQHRAHQLLTGRGRVNAITCPYHAWAYGTEGKLRAARGTRGMEEFEHGLYDLRPVQVEIFADHFVFYNYDMSAPSLASQTGDLANEMRTKVPGYADMRFEGHMAAIPGDVKANWKVLVDNYLECYHCETAHPAFAELLDMKFKSWAHGNWSHQTSGLGKLDNAAFPVSADETNTTALFWWVFPFTTFNVNVGDPCQVSVTIFQPVSVDRTLAVTHLYGPPGAEQNEARNDWMANVVGPEDNALCESVQRGFNSLGFDSGRIVLPPEGGAETEVLVHNFHREISKVLSL